MEIEQVSIARVALEMVDIIRSKLFLSEELNKLSGDFNLVLKLTLCFERVCVPAVLGLWISVKDLGDLLEAIEVFIASMKNVKEVLLMEVVYEVNHGGDAKTLDVSAILLSERNLVLQRY